MLRDYYFINTLHIVVRNSVVDFFPFGFVYVQQEKKNEQTTTIFN